MANRTFVTFPRETSQSLQSVQGGTGRLRRNEGGYAQLTILFALSLGVVQLLDALLTYKGLTLYGNSAEGNFLIVCLCEIFGTAVALCIAKIFSLFCILIACNYGKNYFWMPAALCFLLIIHISFAIVPWSYLLI